MGKNQVATKRNEIGSESRRGFAVRWSESLWLSDQMPFLEILARLCLASEAVPLLKVIETAGKAEPFRTSGG